MATGKKVEGKNRKKDPDASPGMKLLAAYCLLLFGRRPYSMIELTEKLNCSKSTIHRIMKQIALADTLGTQLNESTDGDGRKWYELKRPSRAPKVTLSLQDIKDLHLCKEMVWHLLPDSLRQSVSRAINSSTALLPKFDDNEHLPDVQAITDIKGSIDYSPKDKILKCLLNAMNDYEVCQVKYHAAHGDPRTHRVAPTHLVTSGDSVYIKGWLIREDGEFETTLALQRIEEAESTSVVYARPEIDYHNEAFGIIKGNPFAVRIAFKKAASRYVSERSWSRDQQLEEQSDGSVILQFTATSREEVISKVLSFGPNATLLEPKKMARDIKKRIHDMAQQYSSI